MANAAGTLENIAKTVAQALEPLQEKFSLQNADSLGLTLPNAIASRPALIQGVDAAKTSASRLPGLLTDLINAIDAEDTGQIVGKGVDLTEEIVVLITSVKEVAEEVNSGASAFGAAERAEIESFAAALPGRLVDYLLVSYLENHSEATAAILTFLGLLDREEIKPDPADTHASTYVRKRLRFDRIPDLFSDPGSYLQDLYKWGQGDFKVEELFGYIRTFLKSFDFPAEQYSLGGKQQLEALLFQLAENNNHHLDFELRIPGVEDLNFDIPISDRWSATIGIGAEFDAGLTGEIKPPFQLDFNAPAPGARLAVDMGLAGQDPSGPMVIFGQAEGTRIQAERLSAGVGLVAVFNAEGAEAEPALLGAIKNGKIVIDLSGGDGFIQQALSSLVLEGNLDLSARWEPSKGLMLQGSGGIEISIPTHIDLGPLQFNALYLALKIGTEDLLRLETSAGISLNLGPLQASIERIGLETRANLPDDRDGNVGPLDLSFAFKPPNGVGLAVDAGIVKGGGYLYFDFDKEEYAGALELIFSGFLSLKAIGLITTRMPDGSKGFSMLIIITAEFGSGLQLGFGFTLLGVGGLLGLHRTVNVDPLTEGIRTGAVESVMFPTNVIQNAPQIISDLRSFFPVAQDVFLVGPMAKIGWGTPTLVSLSLGLIVEIPPGNITILGVLKVALPDERAALLVLQVNFIGRLEFDKQRAWFFASIFDSRILFLTIEGEMGLLIAWGSDANFVVSVGGFHPQFTPPPLPFPVPKRIAVNILNESWAKVRVEGYFAVTSNTVQFGARVEVYFGLSVLNVDGHLGFDALFQFSPFYFIISFSSKLSVKVFGIGLFSVRCRGSLSGPTPWNVEGTGSISLLFFDIDVDFEHTWGEEEDTSLPAVDILPLLLAELEADANWKAELPSGNDEISVALRKPEEGSEELVLHPVGLLRVSQRKVPLEIELDKLGNQSAGDANSFSITVTEGNGLQKARDEREPFAIAQYQDMEDSEKLSRPAYQDLLSGLELTSGTTAYQTGPAVKRCIRYETVIIDSNYKRFVFAFFTLVTVFTTLYGKLFRHFLKGNAVSRSARSFRKRKELQPFTETIEVRQQGFSVASTLDNRALADSTIFATEAEATAYLKDEIRKNPNMQERIHVIPQNELNAA